MKTNPEYTMEGRVKVTEDIAEHSYRDHSKYAECQLKAIRISSQEQDAEKAKITKCLQKSPPEKKR